jgi:hypothetical protein
VRAVAVARATVARVASFDKGIFYSKCVQVGGEARRADSYSKILPLD